MDCFSITREHINKRRRRGHISERIRCFSITAANGPQ